MRYFHWRSAMMLCCTIVLFAALNQAKSPAADDKMSAAPAGPTKAVCMVQPLSGSKVTGKVTFTQQADGVEVEAEFTGLTPGKHGFHVHEFGDCSKMDGSCAGGHFNPDKMKHGAPDAAERHVGDLGNIEADADGKATYKRVDTMISLSGPHSILGRAIIVHANPDDYSQPTGNAGGRVGCGVIGIADPTKM
jgi:Cu-Zn family superoxide dismutase